MPLCGFERRVGGPHRSSELALLVGLCCILASSLGGIRASAQEPGTLKWSIDRGAVWVWGSPAIAPDGTIVYFEWHETSPNVGYIELIAANPNGTIRWTKYLTGSNASPAEYVNPGASAWSPAIGADGTIYVAYSNGYHQLQAIDLDGNELWRTDEQYGVGGQPVIGADGTIYIGRNAFTPSGDLKWDVPLAGSNVPQVLAADGTIYSAGDGLRAFDPEGNLLWHAPVGYVRTDLAIGLDGAIYGKFDNDLYAINPDGSVRWQNGPQYALYGGASVGPDGTLYFGPCDLFAFGPDGAPLWQYLLAGGCAGVNAYGTPAVARNGTIIWTTTHNLQSVWPDGTLRWTLNIGGQSGHTSATLGEDGTIYIGTGGVLYAIHDDNGGVAPAPWPTHQHDVRRTGRAATNLTRLTEGESFLGDISQRGADFFSFESAAGESLLIELSPLAGIGSLTLSGQAEHSYFKADGPTHQGTYELLIAPTAEATYYLTVFGDEIDPGGGEYTITARYVDHHLSDLAPRSAGNAGEASLLIRGLGFEEGMQVQLDGAEILTPMAVEIDSEVELLAQFDLTGATVGLYDLEVTWPDMTVETLVDVFDIQPGIGPRLETNLVAPQFIRPDRKNVLWLEYSNTGDANLPAPLFTVRSNVLVSLDQSRILGNEVEVLGVGGTSQPEILTPGEERRIPVYFIGPWGPHVAEFDLSITTDDAGVINWATYKDAMRPEDIAPAEWDTLWPDLIDRLGDTWGEYKQVLRGDAANLADYGVPAHDVGRLIRSEIGFAQGTPEEIISGTLRHQDTFEPLVGATIRARSLDGLSIRQVETESGRPGFFLLDGLEEGPYEIWVDDYRLESPLTLAVGLDETAGLELYAVDLLESEEVPEPPFPAEHSPAMAMNGNFQTLAVWHAEGNIWWAKNVGNPRWSYSGTIPEAAGTRPVVTWDAGLLNGGTSPGWLVAWESLESPRTISWVTGVDSGYDVIWSAPQALTSDGFTDTGLAVAADSNHDPIVLWLQRDLEIADDSDLYFDLPDLSSSPQPSLESHFAFENLLAPEAACVDLSFGLSFALNRQVPVVGGDYGFFLNGGLCSSGGCILTRSGTLGTKIVVGDFLNLQGSFDGQFRWKAQGGSDCRARYVFDEGSLAFNLGVSGERGPVVIIPIPAIAGQVRISAVLSATAGGAMTWKTLPIGLPDEGGFASTLGVTPTVVVEALGGAARGSASGTGQVLWGLYVPPRNPADCAFAYSSYCFEKVCFTLEGRLEALWGLLGTSWKKEWCKPEQNPPPPQPFSLDIRGDELVIESYQPAESEDDIPIYEEVVYTKEAHIGTGAIYEGLPVLAGVDLDLLNDGVPAVARSSTGELLVTWTKDEPTASLGARVFVSSWTGTDWSAPIPVTPDINLVKDPSIVFDSVGNPMVIWSQASNAGLNYADPPASLIPALLAAAEEADIFYSRRVGDVWSAPAILSAIPGRDEQTALAAGPSGELNGAWLNESGAGWTVYVATWSGSSWGTPEAVASADLAERPALAHSPYTNLMLVWAQDTDGDLETAHDWRVFWSERQGTVWSEPATLLNLPAGSAAMPESSGSGFWDPGPPPAYCCSGGSVDPPSPPGGSQSGAGGATSEYVYGSDPNEKIGTAGVGTGGYIEAGEQMDYAVYFENLPAATAPAQEVFVTDCLSAELDWSTLRLNEVAFGDVIVANPGDDALFSHRVTIPDYRGEQSNWWVEIDSELDLMFEPGCLKVTFRTLDPATGELPMDPFAGFLPPEDGTGRGQGHIGFSIDLLADLPDGTEIVNQASIVFDTNAPIVTNEHLNTIGTPEGSFRLNVGRTGAGHGRVTSEPPGIDCGSDCSEVYLASTMVSLTPEPEPGSEFRKWLGDADCYDGQVTLVGNTSCTAVFERQSMFFDGFESGDLSAWSATVQ